jgi:hypothetical protein
LCGRHAERLGEAGQAAGEQQLLCGEAVALVSGCRVKPSKSARFMSAGMLEVFVLAGPVIIGGRACCEPGEEG